MDGSRPGITWPLLKSNGISASLKCIFRAGYVLAANALMGSALSRWEKRKYARKIEETELAEAPVFIIGHWRSGTTLLHNLMALDDRFGYLRNSQALLPHAAFLKSGLVRKLVDFHLMPKRPMDDVALTPEGPQEEEFVLASQFGGGAYLGWYFPKKFMEYFKKYTLLKGMTPEERARFGSHYKSVLKKIYVANGCKPLVMKNPANTGRVDLLLELFPNAKFIYIHRDCAEVYLSAIRLHTKVIESFSFQDHLPENLEAFVIGFYRDIMEKYEADRQLIPPGQLVETTYQDLTQQPVETLGHIYDSLSLPDFGHIKTAITNYMDNQRETYRPAVYQISRAQAAEIRMAMQ